MIRVFYTPRMVVTEGLGFSKSPSKPTLVVNAWREAGLPIEIVEPRPASLEEFTLAHEPTWVRGVLGGTEANGFGTKDPAIAASLPFTTGSLVEAAIEAARTKGVTASPTSGFHHAGFDHNGGFCSANGLVVAARVLISRGLAKRPAILDLDQHYGDGTQNILDHLSLSIPHYTFGAHYITPANAEKWLEDLPDIIRALQADFVIAQLGADPYERDPLSSSQLTADQLRRRDRIVFETCKDLGIGCAFNLAGGYTTPYDEVIQIHLNSMREAARCWFG